MKKILVAAALFLPLQAHAAVKTMQVTIGAGNTAVLSPGAHLNAIWMLFQNNAAHVMRIGDANISTTRGLSVATPGGAFYVGPATGVGRDLGSWYVNGTAGDVLDIVYEDGANTI